MFLYNILNTLFIKTYNTTFLTSKVSNPIVNGIIFSRSK